VKKLVAKDLTPAQYKSANHILGLTIVVEMIFFIIIELQTKSQTANSLLPLPVRIGMYLALFIISAIFVKKNIEKKSAMIVLAVAFTLGYGLLIWTHRAPAMAFVFPTMLIMAVYLNAKLIFGACSVSFVFILMRAIYFRSVGDRDEFSSMNLILMCTVLCAVLGMMSINKLIKFSKDDMDVINEKSAKQKAVADKVSSIVEELDESFKTLLFELDGMNTSISNGKNTIGAIVDKNNDTVSAVENQETMTSMISEHIDATTIVAENTDATKNELLKVIVNGKEVSDNLEKQSREVDENTKAISQVVEKLVKNVEEVSQITSAIYEISDQTTLLALNASIEAAHAGEAGKGFAVVAGEISKLADETKSSTASITEIINELTEVTKNTQEKLQASVQSILAQQEGVTAVNESFQQVESGVTSLAEDISSMNREINKVYDANTSIVNNISTLSDAATAVSSDVISAEEGMEHIALTLEKFNSVIEETFAKLSELKETACN